MTNTCFFTLIYIWYELDWGLIWIAWESPELVEACDEESGPEDWWWLWLSLEDLIFLFLGWKSTDGTWKTPSQTIWELPETEAFPLEPDEPLVDAPLLLLPALELAELELLSPSPDWKNYN